MIGIVAKFTVQPDKAAEFERVMKGAGEKVKANEPGCKLYEFMKSSKEAGAYVFMELYEDQAAVDHHGQTDYLKAAFKEVSPYLAGKPEIEFYVPVS